MYHRDCPERTFMSRARLETELDRLQGALHDMGTLVLERLRTASRALETGDADLAAEVVDGDEEVNDRYLAIERRCIDLLALRQPVAGDLRLVVASFKISTDLERIGDLAVNLAQYATDQERDLFAAVSLSDIATTATELVEDALAAFDERGDAWRCHDVADRDTELDAMCAHAGDVIVRALVERDTEGAEALVEDVSTLLLTVRDLERVGDHAVNIAARTLYMTEGDDSLLE
jgi:phosphate transport system protein